MPSFYPAVPPESQSRGTIEIDRMKHKVFAITAKTLEVQFGRHWADRIVGHNTAVQYFLSRTRVHVCGGGGGGATDVAERSSPTNLENITLQAAAITK